jgi:hypothetical protein
VKNRRDVFWNAFDSIRDNFDTFSITTDLMDLFWERVSDEINLIDEGSQSLLTLKREGPIVETDWIRPWITIIRGKKLSEIFRRDWEIRDCDFLMENQNVNRFWPFRQKDD